MVCGPASSTQQQVAEFTVSQSVVRAPTLPNRRSRKFSEHLAPHPLRKNSRPDWGLQVRLTRAESEV